MALSILVTCQKLKKKPGSFLFGNFFAMKKMVPEKGVEGEQSWGGYSYTQTCRRHLQPKNKSTGGVRRRFCSDLQIHKRARSNPATCTVFKNFTAFLLCCNVAADEQDVANGRKGGNGVSVTSFCLPTVHKLRCLDLAPKRTNFVQSCIPEKKVRQDLKCHETPCWVRWNNWRRKLEISAVRQKRKPWKQLKLIFFFSVKGNYRW